ncbi:N-glycosylase/DNA lyase [Vulcanisaeta distributa]|uniref:DNA-(Apurinic or apyrimidinic site) lyase n=1 Tax=Vulcanisaeta distributa (strain DSM 14429 / JCM 11212 / NBRC 100878 / IC-017) TaxID=572478 RepID=E1QPZ2_VULDI|nr:N-glycosylase/DNA lyase [Vulcanisaeta distributa]ADN51552.1 DNA-(apurinic or apyrimidinic site) lyase [Vulcanisaeta distributa DSM 14429]
MSSIKEKIAEVLRELGIDWVRGFEERDPQYLAVARLCRELRHDVETTLKLTILNALVSYQLTGKGEDHWNYFANYFIVNKPADLCRDFINYVMNSRYLARYRDSRIRRIQNACPQIARLGISNYLSDLTSLWKLLSKVTNTSGDEKTIVFAVKMAYYVGRVCGFDVSVPMEIPIPVDYRVTVITICSGLMPVMGGLDNVAGLARELMTRRRAEIQGIWSEIGRLSGVPPLNLDSVVWVLGGLLINSSFSMNKAINGAKALNIYNGRVLELLHLLGGRCIDR